MMLRRLLVGAGMAYLTRRMMGGRHTGVGNPRGGFGPSFNPFGSRRRNAGW